MQREYALRAMLCDGWSAVPQAIVSHGGGAVLVLADPGGEPLSGAGQPQEGPAAFLRLAIALATTVGAMHAAGVVHRALAPHRFLVDDDGRAFLTGFGHAVRTGVIDPLRDAELDWDDTNVVYMAPELCAGMNTCGDARADLYALGCIFYERLVGLPPFDATDAAALVHAHATQSAQAPHERARHVPEQISRIVMKLLEKAPEQRYGTAAALVADLRRCERCRRRGEIAAQAHFRHAQGAWQRWEALAKARQLPAVHAEGFDAEAGNPAGNRLHELDVRAVLRISNALASDIVPARLVETLLRTTLESAGAEYGALAVLRERVWHVPARADAVDGTIVVTQAAEPFTAGVLPMSLVQAVARTQEGAVIDDASESPVHAQDAYVRRKRPRSVMCVPLMRHATLVGVLYLENNLAARMFTAAKAALVEVIASQAAFALENARLYEELVEQNRQRAHAEEQLRAALASLERASRLEAMGELVASIVHEVGQPIAAVDTSASAALRWLSREPPDVGEAREMLVHINRGAARAKSIIQALRAKARKAEPQFATVDLNEAVREAAALVARQLDALDVVLELHVQHSPVCVHGDRIQLQQVVINLLTNGAEAMAGLETVRCLSLACEADGVDSARVTVEDLGSGIAPDVADRLLEPLFTTKENGMGMGLAISHSIVDAHGGTLTLSTRDGTGTRAIVMLPRADP
ncbi:GAF domain-containing protein [Burkholderia pyrrocinia]|uniref:histidine kinase n=3 Tax=Burkholderiaceae TaxID=119060 RepID=A0A318HZQ3_BURPY|nr:GAF domain-containing protein [Burkholderia pyrrocinia]SFW46779.1 GAF domain-containing protein [Burkholderia sp. NFACC33-1]